MNKIVVPVTAGRYTVLVRAKRFFSFDPSFSQTYLEGLSVRVTLLLRFFSVDFSAGMFKPDRELYEFGEFRLDVDERKLLRCDGTTSGSLPEKAFQTLVHLVRNHGTLVKKEDLLTSVWPDAIVEENNLGKAIYSIRQCLGDSSTSPRYVETVLKHGYRFVADVRTPERSPSSQDGSASAFAHEKGLVIEEDPTERIGAAPEFPPDAAAIERAPRFKTWPILVAGVLLLSALLFGMNAGGIRDTFFPPVYPVRIESLAVMPLEDLSSDASDLYFADGMTDALIDNLSHIGALRVISREAVMKFTEGRRTAWEVGRDLKVDAVLTGSVVHSAERVGVTVNLIDPANDQKLWTNSYERELRDVIILQHEVAADIAKQISAKLTPQQQMQLKAAVPINTEAYDHYLRGKYYLYRQNRKDNAAAIDALERSVTIDPGFAAAHAELAQAYAWKLFLFDPDEKALAERAFISSEKALAIDPNMAVAYLARGRLLWTPANRFPHERAIREYRRALELNPNLDEARNQLALVYNHIGLLDDALKELEAALEINPSNSLAQFRIGETLLFKGEHERALDLLRKVPGDANPALVGHQIVWALFNLGRKEEAEAEIARFIKEFPEDNRGLLTSQQAVIAASNGQTALAEGKINLAIEKGKGFGHFHHTAFFIACAYALLDKPGPAVDWLEFAADNGFPNYPLFEQTKALATIKQDVRYVSLMTRMKDQWEQLGRHP